MPVRSFATRRGCSNVRSPTQSGGVPTAAIPHGHPLAASFRQLAHRLHLDKPVQRRVTDAGTGPMNDFSGISGPGRPPVPGGLPASLKMAVEARSGIAMDDVRVYRDSPKPHAIGALAYAQGRDIHLAPGQERHLPHEAWHVVQQKQGRVRPTRNLGGVEINDDAALERESDRIDSGERWAPTPSLAIPASFGRAVQRFSIDGKSFNAKSNATNTINAYLKGKLKGEFENIFGVGLNAQQFRELKKQLGSDDFTLAEFCADATVKKVTDLQWGLADTRMVRRASFTGQDSADEEFEGHATPIEKKQMKAIERFIHASRTEGDSTNYIAATILINFKNDDGMQQVSHLIPKIWLSGYEQPVYGADGKIEAQADGRPILKSQEKRIKDFVTENRDAFKQNQLSNVKIEGDTLAFTASLHAHSEVAFASDDLKPLFSAGLSSLATRIKTGKIINCTMYLYSYPNVVCTNLCREAVRIAFTKQFSQSVKEFLKKYNKNIISSKNFQSNIRISSKQEFQSAQNKGLSSLAKDTRVQGAASFAREAILEEKGKTYEVVPPDPQPPAKKRKRVATKEDKKSNKDARRATAAESASEGSDIEEDSSDTD